MEKLEMLHTHTERKTKVKRKQKFYETTQQRISANSFMFDLFSFNFYSLFIVETVLSKTRKCTILRECKAWLATV